QGSGGLRRQHGGRQQEQHSDTTKHAPLYYHRSQSSDLDAKKHLRLSDMPGRNERASRSTRPPHPTAWAPNRWTVNSSTLTSSSSRSSCDASCASSWLTSTASSSRSTLGPWTSERPRVSLPPASGSSAMRPVRRTRACPTPTR